MQPNLPNFMPKFNKTQFWCGLKPKNALQTRPWLFPGSSAVEQPAVNRLVAGSNPARGAK